jgi:hypothetical protein
VLLCLLVACAVCLAAADGAVAGTVGLVGGGAFGEKVRVQSVTGPPLSSGPMPSVTLPSTGGGPFTANLASILVPGLLSAQALAVSTQGVLGPAGFVASSAKASTLTAAAGAVKASLVVSRCRIAASGVTTGATFTNLTVLGTPVSATPPPDTSLKLAGVGTLILNELTSTIGSGGLRSITVNAIHLKLGGALGTGDIIVSQSRCIARI